MCFWSMLVLAQVPASKRGEAGGWGSAPSPRSKWEFPVLHCKCAIPLVDCWHSPSIQSQLSRSSRVINFLYAMADGPYPVVKRSDVSPAAFKKIKKLILRDAGEFAMEFKFITTDDDLDTLLKQMRAKASWVYWVQAYQSLSVLYVLPIQTIHWNTYQLCHGITTTSCLSLTRLRSENLIAGDNKNKNLTTILRGWVSS